MARWLRFGCLCECMIECNMATLCGGFCGWNQNPWKGLRFQSPRGSYLSVQGGAQEGDCVFLKRLYDLEGNGRRDKFPDDVGYECFVGCFHVDCLSGHENLSMCMSLLAVLREAWITDSRSETEKPRVIISSDEDGGCVLRFHKIRPSENWLAAGLNSYQTAVLVQDIGGAKRGHS